MNKQRPIRHARVVESDLAPPALPIRQQHQAPAQRESIKHLLVLAGLGLFLLGLVVAAIWIGVLSIIDAVQGHPLASWHHVLAWLDGAKWYALALALIFIGAPRGWKAFKAVDDHRTEKRRIAAEVQERKQRGREYDLRQEEIKLEQMRAALEHERLRAASRAVLLSAGQTAIFPDDGYRRIEGLPMLPPAGRPLKEQITQHSDMPDLPMLSSNVEEDREIPIPEKPLFWEIADLITMERMPLCFVVDDDPASRLYGQTVPQFGTIDDLLSLAVIGKPGKGKTVLLIYYIAILSVYGAEIHIFDPHGAMGELALLHGRPLPGMPATARIYYYDRKDTMMEAVKVLKVEMDDRDVLYRPHMEHGELVSRKVKHPLLVLTDELPILAEFDNEVRAQYKERNQGKAYSEREEVPSLIHLIKRTVLEARKWRMFFIGSSQSIDASILPTKVTDALNSRIVFFNSDRKARMVGLEAEVIKKMLPLIRRAGPGMTIYDCARWDAPKIGAIPDIKVEDMLQFLGVDLDELTESWVVESRRAGVKGNAQVVVEDGKSELSDFPPARPGAGHLRVVRGNNRDIDTEPVEAHFRDAHGTPTETRYDENVRAFQEGGTLPTGRPREAISGPVETMGHVPGDVPFVPMGDEKLVPAELHNDLAHWYKKLGNVRAALHKIGVTNNRYNRHASYILEQRGLKLRRA